MDNECTLVPAIMISDGVITEQGTSKKTLIGCFSRFNVNSFPFRSPPFVITPFLSNLRGKHDCINVTVRLENDKTGHVFGSVSGGIRFHPDAPPLVPQQVFEIPMPMPPVMIPEPGFYSIVVLVDNEILGKRPLEVAALTQPST